MRNYENVNEFINELDKEIANGNQLASILKLDFLLLEQEDKRNQKREAALW